MNPLRRPILSVSVLVSLAILLSLGTWQLYRLEWKTDLIAQVESRMAQPARPLGEVLSHASQDNITYTPITLTGQWINAPAAHVTGTYDGVAGYYVFAPFQPVAGGKAILVNLGFVSMEAATVGKGYPLPNGEVTISALARNFDSGQGLAASMAPPDDPQKGIFYQRRQSPFADYFGMELANVYVDSRENAAPNDSPRGGLTRVSFNNRHLSYALTWYGLAACLVGVYVVMLRQPKGGGAD